MSMMYCVGCDRAVIDMVPGKAVAIACGHCGAGAPILYDGESLAPPASFVRLFLLTEQERALAKAPPHLEYYLGYSDHMSVLKTGTIVGLKEIGSISQADCTGDPECPRQHARAVEKLKERVR